MAQPLVVGRYSLFGEIASGGMGSVHLGRLVSEVGFSRTVAIKRLHKNLAKNQEFLRMFFQEARLASRIRHPNVVATLDVVSESGELLLVMDYVEGESLARLARYAIEQRTPLPQQVCAAIMVGALHGLHAAHEAKSDRGEPLQIVHRDISPQNILVGVDGVARVIDFGIAKATNQVTETAQGMLKGKLAYMAPEQVNQARIDRRTDIFSASVVLWELLTGRRLFVGSDPASMMEMIFRGPIDEPSKHNAAVRHELDAVVLKGLVRPVEGRYATALDMALAIEQAVGLATQREVAGWVAHLACEPLARRAAWVAQIEEISAPSTAHGLGLLEAAQSAGKPPSTLAWLPNEHTDQTQPPTIQTASRKTRPAQAGAGLVALLTFGGVAAAWLWSGWRREPPGGSPLDAAAVPSSTLVVTSAESTSASTQAMASATESAMPTTTAPPQRPTVSAPQPTTPAKPTRPSTTAGPNCAVDYTVDERGIKRFKRECIK